MSTAEGVDYWRCGKCGQVNLLNYHTKILPGICGACERRQDGSKPFAVSPRHGFRCDKRPTRPGPVWGVSLPVNGAQDYSAILDCVYEMAEQVATGNGVHVDTAIEQVLRDEGWKILPSHRAAIRNRICDDRIEALFAGTEN